ncbi:MAG: right-handed parallel beta-helix repeat-containing protein, partial [Candidatus Thorarchaeota archaeon]|nr:right-handed parallel beta-helix repeat-containing protein [Candidatus Thorarchaeota archaeon]
MTEVKSKNKLGASILFLFLLIMSFSISITPLIITEATSGNIAFEQSSERLTSHESIDTSSMREVYSPERLIDATYNYDSQFTGSKEWNAEQPEREPYQSEPLILSPGTPHATIEITSNADFDTQGWPGDGSPGTPYLIDDLEINATAANPGISITGTDVYFVISDCIINGSYEVSTGIVLNSVTNAMVYNNTCFEGDIGILLNQTDGISVIENQCYSMTRAGIYLDRSDDNTIHDNFVVDGWDGIYLERSNLNYVDENFCAGNNWGIDLYWTSNE